MTNYVSAISNFLPKYNDVDYMRFVRITDMFDKIIFIFPKP